MGLKWGGSTSHLATRGRTRRAWSSSDEWRLKKGCDLQWIHRERPIFIITRSLHQTDMIFHDWRYGVDGCNLSRLEALRGRSRSFAIGGVAWTHCVRAISIRWPRPSSHMGDVWDSLEHWIFIGRQQPMFRLDREPIRARLITNFSLISSNFPLDFRTSTRKNPRKFASIHENWSPILVAIGLVVRFDQLWGGNLSFY